MLGQQVMVTHQQNANDQPSEGSVVLETNQIIKSDEREHSRINNANLGRFFHLTQSQRLLVLSVAKQGGRILKPSKSNITFRATQYLKNGH